MLNLFVKKACKKRLIEHARKTVGKFRSTILAKNQGKMIALWKKMIYLSPPPVSMLCWASAGSQNLQKSMLCWASAG